VRGVAAKGLDILLNPGESSNQVHQAVVSRRTAAFGVEQSVNEEADKSESVLHGHDDYALRCQEWRVQERSVSAAGPVTASMDVNHHGLLLAMGSLGGDEDVQEQAVFRAKRLIVRIELRADIPERGSIPCSYPTDWRLGRFPAEISDGRGSIWNAAKRKNVTGKGSLDGTGLHLGSGSFDGNRKSLRRRLAIYIVDLNGEGNIGLHGIGGSGNRYGTAGTSAECKGMR